MPDFTFDEGRYPATTKFSSSFWTRIWFLRNKLKGELAGILQRQRVGIIAMKFEITRTHFLSDIFAVVAVVVNSLLKMDLKLTYRLRARVRGKFWNGRIFYLCNSFTRNRANSVRDCSTVYKSPYENLLGSPGPVKRKNAGCVQVFVRSKICPERRVNLANSWWWLSVALVKKLIFHTLAFEFWFAWTQTTLDVRASVTFINLSAPWLYMYF